MNLTVKILLSPQIPVLIVIIHGFCSLSSHLINGFQWCFYFTQITHFLVNLSLYIFCQACGIFYSIIQSYVLSGNFTGVMARSRLHKNKDKDAEELRRRYTDQSVELRKAKKDEQLQKQRNILLTELDETSPLKEKQVDTPKHLNYDVVIPDM
ncbi:importin alpha, putative [Schistosoma mansoni]|uniref:Importin alpha, putative n=1 Tax=Schistosoma mansoni TaxID=6183 RepID=G4LV38_SCHMA|nr:importin alpha, putative [Schistosoma mansoni]|eukprot:XP_018645140.1 importin alpha, putative [Schistosoma mansoni]